MDDGFTALVWAAVGVAAVIALAVGIFLLSRLFSARWPEDPPFKEPSHFCEHEWRDMYLCVGTEGPYERVICSKCGGQAFKNDDGVFSFKTLMPV